jgi:hypothetical protein
MAFQALVMPSTVADAAAQSSTTSSPRYQTEPSSAWA